MYPNVSVHVIISITTHPNTSVPVCPSRGLLLPRVGVECHGVERTDVGFLGGGIYFSDSFRSVGLGILGVNINNLNGVNVVICTESISVCI